MTIVEHPSRNGVDTAGLFATIDAVKGNTDIAKFQFRATNTWVSGTHNRSTIHGFYGAMQEMTHKEARTYDADHEMNDAARAERDAWLAETLGFPPPPN